MLYFLLLYYHNKLYDKILKEKRNENLRTLIIQSSDGAASPPQPISPLPSLPDKFIKEFTCLNDDDCGCIRDGVCIDKKCISIQVFQS